MALSDPAQQQASRERRILLVDADATQLQGMARVLRSAVHGTVEPRTELGHLSDDSDYDLVAVNYDRLEPSERDRLVTAITTLKRRTRLLLISAGECRDDFQPLLAQRALTNLLARNGQVSSEDLIVTVQKILRRDVFGLEKYFVWGVESISTRLTRSTDKARVLEQAERYAKRIGLRARQAAQFCTVTDELITNGIYNAPRDERGESRYGHVPRERPVVLEPGEGIEVKFCSDGRRLGVASSDPFGALTPERLLDYLAKCFRRGEDQVDTKPGGAGLGFYYIYQAVSHLVVNIAEGERTEMIGLIDIGASHRDFASSSKSFNVFVA